MFQTNVCHRVSQLSATIQDILARLGDPDSRTELGAEAPPLLPAPWHSTESRHDWKRLLQHAGKRPTVTALVALSRRALATYQQAHPGASNQRGRVIPVEEGARLLSATLDAVEAWVGCPCREHAGQVRQHERDWSALGLGHMAAARGAVELVQWTWSATMAPRRFEREAMVGLFFATAALPPSEVDALLRARLREALRPHRP
jgi:hypothetical protein